MRTHNTENMTAGTKLRALRRVAAGDIDHAADMVGFDGVRRLIDDGLLGPKLGLTRKGRRVLEAEAFIASVVGPVR